MTTARSMYRHLMALTYLTQVVSAGAGALSLWLVIDFWLTKQPFLSAVFTAVAFYNGHLFLKDTEQRRSLRAQMQAFEKLERELMDRLR